MKIKIMSGTLESNYLGYRVWYENRFGDRDHGIVIGIQFNVSPLPKAKGKKASSYDAEYVLTVYDETGNSNSSQSSVSGNPIGLVLDIIPGNIIRKEKLTPEELLTHEDDRVRRLIYV